jgi:hypothetical protein
MRALRSFGPALTFLVFLVVSCRSTYKQGNVELAIHRICEQEYGVSVVVKTEGKTMGAQIATKGVLSQDLTLTDAAWRKIDDVMLATSRVTLSSEFVYDFFVISILDVQQGVQISFVRYIKDIRRLAVDDISRTDFVQRMLKEVEYLPANQERWGAEYRLHEYTLEEFLAKQLSERLKTEMANNFAASALFKLARTECVFIPGRESGEKGDFRVVLYFSDNQAFETRNSSQLRERFLEVFKNLVGETLRRYEFQSFSGLEILDASSVRLAYYEHAALARGNVNRFLEIFRNIK